MSEGSSASESKLLSSIGSLKQKIVRLNFAVDELIYFRIRSLATLFFAGIFFAPYILWTIFRFAMLCFAWANIEYSSQQYWNIPYKYGHWAWLDVYVIPFYYCIIAVAVIGFCFCIFCSPVCVCMHLGDSEDYYLISKEKSSKTAESKDSLDQTTSESLESEQFCCDKTTTKEKIWDNVGWPLVKCALLSIIVGFFTNIYVLVFWLGLLPFMYGFYGRPTLTKSLSIAGLVFHFLFGFLASLIGCISHLLIIFYQQETDAYVHFYFAEHWYFLALFIVFSCILTVQLLGEIKFDDFSK